MKEKRELNTFVCPHCQEVCKAKEYLVPSWENFSAEITCDYCNKEFSIDVEIKTRIETYLLG